ncbi:MAG: aminotransferase [Bdellovibrionales bacterium RIFOXYD12_FULL_39_22]|nr:MAG: aminotransferase [Bdellovibrionales bacterium RIFOXYB1_FULL_39_21]OFZ42594.1 MAG: aminotransferase [Bdellovibrionales bacterium RIFOXYC12_FULL_39_17]OFZ47138.1 MAG: aminotransferase [Bdellovibrionales bacterium RIFOXYC1_FULL_39_130]OFZ75386.1 MAG: aminotransferase [Bdellovibrionales bacterium RIFOXYD1_FULL_39_84]OFZ93337.1 MAG: aminotransferase [Bdellovibrionales bacterium RIFOXYD12_FULL_39_22]HLE09987.1 PLP-dependent aminotransferase family protein [Bacteriovoracaceae bacterium]
MIDLIKNYSITSRRVKGSAIRELLKLTNKPDMISFAGGLPSPESFPTESIAEIAAKVLKDKAHIALQYTETEGLIELREQVAILMKKDGIHVGAENILITASSQQALDLVGRVFIDPTDPLLVELPTYLGGLQAFTAYGARFIGVASDNQGMIMEDLESKLRKLQLSEEHYKFIYTVPDFQNPSGVTWTNERRQKAVELSNRYNVLLIDDSPYRELRFEGKRPDALHAIDKEGNVITCRTFSKIFAPGLRLGWIVGHKNIIAKLSVAKQSVDLCTSGFNQLIAAEFLKQNLLDNHVKKIIDIYRVKRDAMDRALEKYMPKGEGISWMKPEGGLFLFLKLPELLDADDMFHEAIEKKVAYVIGSVFHCDGKGQNTMRLNFSYPTLEQIDIGISRLADTIKERIVKLKRR